MQRQFKLRGPDIRPGEIMRPHFGTGTGRRSDRWFRVVSVHPCKLGTIGVKLEGDGYDRVLRSETRQIRREL
jgi:hypothetical protein